MREFDAWSRANDRDHAARGTPRELAEPTPQSAAERAQEAVVSAEREVHAAELASVDVQAAQRRNDLAAWRALHDRRGISVEAASQAVERARTASRGEALERVAALEQRLAELTRTSAELDIAPRGYEQIALEAELLAVIRRRPEGSARDGFARKEAEVGTLMAQLSAADSRALVARIARNQPDDELVAAFLTPSNLMAERQRRLLEFLKGAPRREAVRGGRAHVAAGAAPAQAHGPSVAPDAATSAAPAPSVAPREPAPPQHSTSAGLAGAATPATTPSRGPRTAQPPVLADPAGAHGPTAASQPPGDPRPETEHSVTDPTVRVPSAAVEDARVATTAAGPQLSQRGHAMQYYRLHQPAFLAAVRARLLATNLGTGSAQLAWTRDAARFIDELGFALTGPESRELPELLYPGDPWALIDAHRGMDADPTSAMGALGWAPGAGFALAGAVEASVRASLPRMAARYVAAHGASTASELVASHPMDRVVATALCANDVVSLAAGRPGKSGLTAAPPGYDVQTQGVRLVTSYRWLGERDPSLWNWIRVEEPANATAEEIALTLWNRTDYAYGLTLIDGNVAIPKEWARQLPGIPIRDSAAGPQFEVFERSPAEQLAASKLGDGVALEQGLRPSPDEAASSPGSPARPVAPDRAQLLDTLDSTAMIFDELRRQLTPWSLASVLEPGRAFALRQRAALPGASPVGITAWAPVVTGQRAIVGEAAAGLIEALQVLAEAGVSPTQLSALDRSHPGLQVLHGYAAAAGTAQLVESARATLAHTRAAHAALSVNLIARASTEAGRELSRLQQADGDDRVTAGRARELTEDHARLSADTATLQSQMMATGAPDPVLLESAGLDAATLGLRAHVANLRAALRALGGALDAADDGVLAAIANLSAGTRLVMTAHHLDMASTALGEVETRLDVHQPARIHARYDAMPPSAYRERARQFELRDTRKAQLAIAQQQCAEVVKRHQLDGALFERAEQAIHDAQIRKLVANVAVLLAVGVLSGGVAAVAGDFAAGLVGGGRIVTTVGEAAGTLRTARVVGGIVNAAVDAGVNAAAQTTLNGEHLGSSFAENLLTNAAIRAALRPLHAVIRSWGGLDEDAYALWTQQGGHWKVALARTTVVSAELITSAAVGYVVHRLATYARGETPDEETITGWAIQGATLTLGHVINRRLTASLERLKTTGALAGELVGRMQAQQQLAQSVADANQIDRGVAMQLLADHQQSLQDEIALWRKVSADPEALHRLGLDRAQVAAKLAGAEAQAADTQGQAFRNLPLRFAGLMQEVEGGRLWVGDPEQIAEAIANARAARLGVDVVPPAADAGQGARVWRVTLNGEALEIRERAHVKLTPAELESRGAHAVPGSRFSGLATQRDPKAKLTPEQAIERAHHAVTILDGVKQEFLSIDSSGNIWVSVGAEHCLIDITVGDAMADVAQHTYTRGQKHARIKISEHARLEDVTRAVAHELAEIRGLMGDATLQVTDKPALAKGSTADKMQHHDLGRRAELEILLYELESQPSRRTEILDEIDKLAEHLGFDKKTIAADARARKMLGDPIIKGVDLMNGKKRLLVRRSAMHEPRSKIERGNWEFYILVDLPGMPNHMIAQGHVQLDSSGRPLEGPNFTFDKRRKIDGSEFRIDIEGINSLTDFALDAAIKAFTKDFGHPPSELPGSLADDNKAIFQKEYAVQIANGATPDVAEQRAAAKTPFVIARAKKGYTDVKVDPPKETPKETVDIVLGHPPRIHKVPATVQITARKP